MLITVANLKGGVGKTTTSVMLALGFAKHGRTLLIDADPKQSSALEWAGLAENWPLNCSVVAISGKGLAQRASSLIGDYEHVIIDCGAKSSLETRQALMVTDQLIVPASPRALDIVEIPTTFTLAAEIDAVSPVDAVVLLTQVRAATRSSVDVRAVLLERDIPTLRSQVRLREAFAGAYGTVPDSLMDYDDVLAELIGGEKDGR